jgi:hypothetical protein
VVRLDLPTGALELDAHVVERLRDAAAEMAGRSSAARDLSLVLDRALTAGGGVALRRAEALNHETSPIRLDSPRLTGHGPHPDRSLAAGCGVGAEKHVRLEEQLSTT